MKTLQTIMLVSLVMTLISCKDDDSLESPLLIGNWQSEEIYVNGKLQDDMISNSTHLSIQRDYTYFRNYTSGSWSLTEDKLDLMPKEELSIRSRQYKIIEASLIILLLEVTLTESEYRWDFEDIAEDEVITVREKYRRK